MTFKDPFLILILGIILITLLDTVGAIASNKLNFRYTQLILLSLLNYVFIGFMLGKISDYSSMSFYTGLLGLFDGTIGLKLSIYFKANMGLDENRIKKLQSVQTALMMVVLGIIFGNLGYTLS